MSILMILLEGARVHAIKGVARNENALWCETLFSHYHKNLYEKYGMFGCEISKENIGSTIYSYGDQIKETSYLNLFNHWLLSCEVEEYNYATDAGGYYMGQEMIKMMKVQMPWKLFEGAKDMVINKEKQEEETGNVEDKLEHADESIEESKKQQQEAAEKGEQVEVKPVKENPLKMVAELKKQGILSLVLEKTDKVSSKVIDLDTTIGKRKLHTGSNSLKHVSQSLDERLWLNLYRQEYLKNYTSAEDDQAALQYELEYLVAGKGEDRKNLESVCNQLVLLRTVPNFIKNRKDPEVRAKALSIATALAGVTAMPAILKPIEEGIICAYSYMDALEDVKKLLKGEKVDGIKYRDYVLLILMARSEATTMKRTMDIMEKNADVKLDEVIVRVKLNFTYKVPPVFLSTPFLYEKDKSGLLELEDVYQY